jgi:hypothetical protein
MRDTPRESAARFSVEAANLAASAFLQQMIPVDNRQLISYAARIGWPAVFAAPSPEGYG